MNTKKNLTKISNQLHMRMFTDCIRFQANESPLMASIKRGNYHMRVYESLLQYLCVYTGASKNKTTNLYSCLHSIEGLIGLSEGISSPDK